MRFTASLLLLGTLAGSPAIAAAQAVSAATQQVPVREGYAVTADGIRIYYRVAGRGPETVMAPFALFHGSSLDGLAQGRQVVTYDPRNRGRSSAAPLSRISLEQQRQDLEAVRKAVGAEHFALIGWSGGGMEMFAYALANPERVTRLIQLAPVPARGVPYTDEMIADRRRRTDGAAWTGLQARIKAGEYKDKPAEQCRAEAKVNLPVLLADPAKLPLLPDVCDLPNEQPAALGAYFGALWPAISSFDHRGDLAKLKIPRLVIYPAQDNITRAGVEEWVRGQDNARLLTIDGSGHFPAYEQPVPTIAAMETFLSGRWPDGAESLPATPQ